MEGGEERILSHMYELGPVPERSHSADPVDLWILWGMMRVLCILTTEVILLLFFRDSSFFLCSSCSLLPLTYRHPRSSEAVFHSLMHPVPPAPAYLFYKYFTSALLPKTLRASLSLSLYDR